MRRHRLSRLAVCALLAPLLALAACGSQGYAPKLGNVATMTLKSAGGPRLGVVTFTPFYATHIATYYRSVAVPYQGARLPLELRSGSCVGAPLAQLTDGAATPITNGPAVAVDARGGVDVATQMRDSLYVVVRDHANDANAPELACGHPLSGRRQYFDLYSPGQGSNGYELGISLMEPMVATRVNVALDTPASQETPWAVYTTGCAGQALAQGQIGAGAQGTTAVIFAPINASHWSLMVGQSGCANVGA